MAATSGITGEKMSEIVTTVVGLAIGLATGYYFERRARLDAERNAADLERQLAELREGLYTVGGAKGRAERRPVLHGGDLRGEVLAWVSERQDASGRVAVARVMTAMKQAGHSRGATEAAIDELVGSGVLMRDAAELVKL